MLDEAPNLEQWLSHPRSRAPGARPGRSSSEWMHAVARSVPTGLSGKSPEVQSACTNGQRGWNRQPGRLVRRGRAASRGSSPASLGRRRQSGTDRSRLSVYGWRGLPEDLVDRPGLDHLARVHHGDALAGLGDDREVVGDEDDADLELSRSDSEQLQDLVLDRHVEGVVGSSQSSSFGSQRERDRDHHALPHAARELVRVGLVAPRRVRDADLPHQLDRALPRLVAGCGRAACAALRRSGRRRASPG